MGTTELVHSAAWRYHQEPVFLFCTIVSSLVWVLNSFWWLIICCTSRHYILNISDWKKENILYNLTVIFLKTEDIFSWKQPSSLPFYVLLSTVGTMTDLDYLPERNRCFGSYFSSVQISHSVVSNSLRPHESQHSRALSITISRSSLKLASIKSVMPSSQLILSSPSPPAPSPSQHQSLFQWVNSSHEVAKVLEFQL